MDRPRGVNLIHFAVDTSIPWPTVEKEVNFIGHKIILRPSDNDGAAPDVRVQIADSMKTTEGIQIILNFFSMLSWWEQRPARIDMGGATNVPFRYRIHCLPPPQCPDFSIPDECQYPSDAKAQLSIALYREAMSVNNVFYKFLGFFKIINCYFDDRKKTQIQWINSMVPLLKSGKAVERIKYNQSKQMINYAKHLYSKCRSAIAHASVKVHTNPDNPSDLRRIQAELPIVQELAINLIEQELGVKNRYTKVPRRPMQPLQGK